MRSIDIDKLLESIKQQENKAWQESQRLNTDIERYWYNMGKHAVLQGLLEAIDHGFFDKKKEESNA